MTPVASTTDSGPGRTPKGSYENPAIDDLVKHADFEHARSVLEFGCGTGSFARRFFETVVPADARYLGLDISGTMIGLATRRLEPWQDSAEVRQTDGTPGLVVVDASFDRLLVTYVFDLLDETVASLPGPIRRSLGRNRENRLGTRNASELAPQLGERLDPKPNCVGQVPIAR